MRLCIAAWERVASWHDRGWAGEKNAATIGCCIHRKSQESTIRLFASEQDWKDIEAVSSGTGREKSGSGGAVLDRVGPGDEGNFRTAVHSKREKGPAETAIDV